MALTKYYGKRHETMPSIFSNLLEDFMGGDVSNSLTRELTNWVPAVNVSEKKDMYCIEVAAPGLKKEDFKISMEDDVLTISAHKEEKKEEKDKEDNYTRREFNYSSFTRSFTLPEDVDADKISAKYTDGVLNMCVPKKPEMQKKSSKEIKIS